MFKERKKINERIKEKKNNFQKNSNDVINAINNYKNKNITTKELIDIYKKKSIGSQIE